MTVLTIPYVVLTLIIVGLTLVAIGPVVDEMLGYDNDTAVVACGVIAVRCFPVVVSYRLAAPPTSSLWRPISSRKVSQDPPKITRS